MPQNLSRQGRQFNYNIALGPNRSGYARARRANLRRYAEILRGYDSRYDSVMGSLRGIFSQRRTDIQTQGRSQIAGARQQAVSSGLTGTALTGTQQGIQNQVSSRLNRLSGQEGALNASTMAQLLGQKLNFMERREDMYPDLRLLTQLLSRYGMGRGMLGM
ncbi:MAG: hypothetical protein QGH74_01980 [Candidatus Brocadiia bacterium]|jgi:hypothetical protein|nr:hypothetical protein [Candidatus Brocadiia bacterium]